MVAFDRIAILPTTPSSGWAPQASVPHLRKAVDYLVVVGMWGQGPALCRGAAPLRLPGAFAFQIRRLDNLE